MQPIIDTHAHLYEESFDADRGAVLERAFAAGVEKIVTVSETIEDARRNLELARIYPALLPAAGLYPAYLDPAAAEGMQEFIRRNRQHLAAIGEVGLDFRLATDEGEREVQRRIFEGFIDLSLELGLPLNVHSRSAGRYAVSLLLEKGAGQVQLHAFDGKAGAALPGVEAGFFFSVPPSVLRSRQKEKLVRRLPLGCLLVETDSPVLGPEPDKRNEPANAAAVVQRIAEIKAISRQEVQEVVFENTRRLYGDWI